tara:strand:+ start:483 stop:884 length:402 start_codon:yes stop_codon:yes gene_type:complete
MMLSNYPDHQKYFSMPVNSVSTFYIGKSSRKLDKVEVKIHKEFNSLENVEIEGKKYEISTTYIAFELTGLISEKGVTEGCHSVQAYSMIINALMSIFDEYCQQNGVFIYENDYDQGWNRRKDNEPFWYLNRDE